jgi:hypothetical protein
MQLLNVKDATKSANIHLVYRVDISHNDRKDQ